MSTNGKKSNFAKKVTEALYESGIGEYRRWTEKGMWKRYHNAVEKNDVKTAAKVINTLEQENYHFLTDRMLRSTGATKEEQNRLFKNYQQDDKAYQDGKISYEQMNAGGDIGKPSAYETIYGTRAHIEEINKRARTMTKEQYEKDILQSKRELANTEWGKSNRERINSVAFING